MLYVTTLKLNCLPVWLFTYVMPLHSYDKFHSKYYYKQGQGSGEIINVSQPFVTRLKLTPPWYVATKDNRVTILMLNKITYQVSCYLDQGLRRWQQGYLIFLWHTYHDLTRNVMRINSGYD